MLVGLNIAISDLGSEIFSTVYNVKADFAIRRCVLLFVIALVTPFCFLRRVDFLSATSSVAVIIYVIFLLNLFLAYMIPKIFSMHSSLKYLRLWRPEGLVRCAPIIASSLCCQVQVSTIYSSLKNPPLATMKKVLLYALSFIFVCYSTAGLMGYIAFYRGLNEPLPGDMLASYPEDHGAVHIRLGFLYTIAASLPLLLFPLRTALHSLLFEEAVIEEGPLYVDVPSPIPNLRFYWLTCGAIFLSVIASQTTDKVEVILAYTGGFAGGVSCYLLPAVIGARAVGGGAGGRRGQLAKKLVIYLLYFLGVLIFLSPVLTFLGVDA
ncbi:unnamed protein product [Taenia asiatica]|uniref:Aa_trans domain-containing protein n=1 Tax=Taenia asiatica TaxID=60517 RepID=A0A0R3W4F7_TAEAS|nr:unnamed protein product [Taenia asiatica]